MQGIIDAAERAATEIRADARSEADTYLQERRREAEREEPVRRTTISAAPDLGAAASSAEPETATAQATERKVPEEALLRATQMAIAGSQRAEIERVLEAEFHVVESSAVVDEIL